MKQTLLRLSLLFFVFFTEINVHAYDFSADGIYYNILSSTDKTCSVTYATSSYNSYSGDVEIPSKVTYDDIEYSVTSIGYRAFNNSSDLTRVTIPTSIISIGESAFSGSGITSIIIPNSVTSIGNYAFWGCESLSTVSISNSISEINKKTFQNCSKLTSVTIPSSVTSIGDYAFYGCTLLSTVTIPNSVESIGKQAFLNCANITSLNLPPITTINESTFYGCTKLSSITVPNSVTNIGDCAFYGCTNLSSVSIPASVTTIGNSAFYKCEGLTTISIPNSITQISESAFSCCYNLTSVSIPNSVKSIGSAAFYSTGLTSIIIPTSIASIGSQAFGECNKLYDITCKGSSAPVISDNTFSSNLYPTYLGATLHVRNGVKNIFEAADYWKKFSNIVGTPIKITDAESEIDADTYSAQDIEYTRTGSAIKDGNFGSFCLPYDIDLSTTNCFTKVYVPVEMSFYNTNTKLLSLFLKNVDLNSTVAAGTPFLAVLNGNDVVLDNSGDITFSASYDNPSTKQFTVFDFDGAITGTLYEDNDITLEWGGTYKKTAPYGTKAYTFKTNGNFGVQTSNISPFRAFLVKNETLSSAKVIGIEPIFSDDNATEVEQLIEKATEKKNEIVKVYGIDGKLVGHGVKADVVEKLNPGIYIINGNKIIK